MDWRSGRFWPAMAAFFVAFVWIVDPIAAADPAATAAGGTNASAAKKIRSIEGITEYELPNGLKLLLFPDPSKPTVTVNMTVLVGSRHEGYGEAGMAHLLEHMLFKGTPSFPGPKDIPRRSTAAAPITTRRPGSIGRITMKRCAARMTTSNLRSSSRPIGWSTATCMARI